MNKQTTISIDLDVFKAIQSRLESFDETPNTVLRRVFGLERHSSEITDIQKSSNNLLNDPSPTPRNTKANYYHWKGVNFKVGLNLRKKYKQSMLTAQITEYGFYFDGKYFNSPSDAAVHATGTAVNGWRFWEYYDDIAREWRLIDYMRQHSHY